MPPLVRVVRTSSRRLTVPTSAMPSSSPIISPGVNSSSREITTPMTARMTPSGLISMRVLSPQRFATVMPASAFAMKPTKSRPMPHASTTRRLVRSNPNPGSAKPKMIETSAVITIAPTTGVAVIIDFSAAHQPGARLSLRQAPA